MTPSKDTREPVRVRMVKFQSPQDGPGLSVASSCTSSEQSNKSRHTIVWMPWLRHFKITFQPPGNEPSISGFIHETRVAYWEEIEPAK